MLFLCEPYMRYLGTRYLRVFVTCEMTLAESWFKYQRQMYQNEPPREKTNNLHRRKQSRRSAVQ